MHNYLFFFYSETNVPDFKTECTNITRSVFRVHVILFTFSPLFRFYLQHKQEVTEWFSTWMPARQLTRTRDTLLPVTRSACFAGLTHTFLTISNINEAVLGVNSQHVACKLKGDCTRAAPPNRLLSSSSCWKIEPELSQSQGLLTKHG